MKNRHPVNNVEVSVRQRLLNLSRDRGEDYEFVLTRYANERFLYRLSKSEHAERFILKGGMLFLAWTEQLYRPTRDIDFLGFGDNYDNDLIEAVANICGIPVDSDGLTFDIDSMRISDIREDEEYQGKRINLVANIGVVKVRLQIDVGFGDVVIPGVEMIEYPTLLDFPSPKIRSYSKDSVIAEKFEAMVKLGMINSRMKDFYDIWMLSKTFDFDGDILKEAIEATFNRRKTPILDIIPTAFTSEYAEDRDHMKQWSAFLKRNRLDVGDIDFSKTIEEISHFLSPIISAIVVNNDFGKIWTNGGSWSDV